MPSQFVCQASLYARPEFICQASFYTRKGERRGGGVILYIKESIKAYEITLKSEADCEEAIWCNIVTKNSTLTIGVVYHSPNIEQEEYFKRL